MLACVVLRWSCACEYVHVQRLATHSEQASNHNKLQHRHSVQLEQVYMHMQLVVTLKAAAQTGAIGLCACTTADLQGQLAENTTYERERCK